MTPVTGDVTPEISDATPVTGDLNRQLTTYAQVANHLQIGQSEM